MKHWFIAFALIVASQAIAQDNPKSEFARDFLPVWTTSTNNAVEVAQAMPEELYDYKRFEHDVSRADSSYSLPLVF